MSMKEGISQETTDIFTLVMIDINIIMAVRFKMTQDVVKLLQKQYKSCDMLKNKTARCQKYTAQKN